MPTSRKTLKASPSPKPDPAGEVDIPLSTDTPQYIVDFDHSASDRSLLIQIEETLVQHKAIDFSDLCKEALQQLLAPDAPAVISPQLSPSDSYQVERLQEQVSALEAKLANLPGMNRFEHLESLVTSLERRIDGLGRREIEQPIPQPQSADLQLDPLLSRLSNLLEDF